MANEKQCIDFYGEKLKIGDEVIPMLEEALIIGIGGTISKIEYSEKYNNHYITIIDKEGNVLLEDVDARCYTTQERYDERENQEYVYSLTFCNNKFSLMTYIPLTNKTNPDYEIPDETCLVILDAIHLEEKGKKLADNSYQCTKIGESSIFSFFTNNGNVKLCHEKEDNYYYLLNSKTHDWHPLDTDYRTFENKEELKKYVKGIIEYFNNADLTYVNNDEEFDKNENGKKFEMNLIQRFKH